MLDVVLAREPATCVVMATSFPAMGRTVRDSQVRVHGVPLPFTEYWLESREPALANLLFLLESAGLRARTIELATVRGDFDVLKSTLAKTDSDVVAVCDAETDEDLGRIAEASLAVDRPGFFIGSAGFAHALAHCVSRAGVPRSSSHRCEPSTLGALVVVGSRSQASRAALAQVTDVGECRTIQRRPVAARRRSAINGPRFTLGRNPECAPVRYGRRGGHCFDCLIENRWQSTSRLGTREPAGTGCPRCECTGSNWW